VAAVPAQKPNIFQRIAKWFAAAADWIEENLGDPAIAQTLREDLGLNSSSNATPSLPAASKDKIKQYADAIDPDKSAFEDTVAEISDVVNAALTFGDAVKSDGMTAWDVVFLLMKVGTADSLRLRYPWAYAIARAALLIGDEADTIEQFDPDVLLKVLRGESLDPGESEKIVEHISEVASLVVVAEAIFEKKLHGVLDGYYGWDPAPDSTTPAADRITERAFTVMLGTPEGDGDGGGAGVTSAVTLLLVPREHGGPALFTAFGGALKAKQVTDKTTYDFEIGATDAFDMFVPFGDSPRKFEMGGAPNAFVKLDAVPTPKDDEPALRIGQKDSTRIDIGGLGWGFEAAPDRAGFRASVKDGELVIVLGEGDGFLQQLPGGEIKASFDLGVAGDTAGGLRFEGGTQLRVTIPVSRSLFGVFTIFHLDLALGPSTHGRDIGLELSGAFALDIGPFRASVDRLGVVFDTAFRQGNVGFLDVDVLFKPPNGIGLVLDAGPIKGGGYLFVDTERGEYAGALELKLWAVSVKAIGLLSTKMPDGSQGWSLLILLYVQFRVQLGFGFVLTGLGGMIGVQHAPNIDALQSGLRQGVLDDILFPQDPVADAPRIINRLRIVFPPTPRALTIGPMVELGWGTPNIVTVRIGLIVQIDNAINSGGRPVSLSRIVLLGQLLVQVPPKETQVPPIVKLLVDVLGWYDVDEESLGIDARLRDSKIGPLDVTGMLVVRARFKDDPTFILSVGGFHPKFKDLPPGLPSPIDRIGVGFSIGPVKLSITSYVAVTSSTFQTGAAVDLSAKLGPAEIKGWLGYDALFQFEPTFHFIVDVRAGIAIKISGHTLAGVDFSGELEGPGRWHISGSATFSILFWDFSVHVDESWGDAPALPRGSTNVGQLLQAELSKQENWSAGLPDGGEHLVTLATLATNGTVVAHPLGRIMFAQKTVPFGLDITHFGANDVQGATRFDLGPVTLGGASLANPTVRSEFFTRSQFLDLSNDDRLAGASFERFPAGIEVGTAGFAVPAVSTGGTLDYETAYLDPTKPRWNRLVVDRAASFTATMDDVAWQSRHGAAAKSALRKTDDLQGPDVKVSVNPPPLTVASTDTLASVKALTGLAAESPSLAAQQAGPGTFVVESFEVS
jgi:uncharacterized protein DUF6603